MIEDIINKKFSDLINGGKPELNEYFRIYNNFFEDMGYDAIPFECIISDVLPGNKALYGHEPGSVHTMEDFNKYPWEKVPELFKEKYYPLFQAFSNNLPAGMKGVGGPGNGVFECIQDIVGYEKLCIMKYEDEELFPLLFQKMGDVIEQIWKDFIQTFSNAYCIMRFGDDLGYKTSTLLSPDDIREHILPAYKRVINVVHGNQHPFVLHCCGKIFPVMDDLIGIGINAKHSNEDQIAPFPYWVDTYGDRIALFGGIDMDHLVREDEKQIAELVKETCAYASKRCGFALGSGNSIAPYVPAANYLAMNRAAREFRGEKFRT
ncbi:uroporphyrinogen decarboxylase family protein [Treponema primitia]|uniref:uroporphyrinogen decarboxylase family protein n=1 Tax=Treponema primitia TaxID=88058 RepID=UPI0002EC7C0F|nr:uroporphyrinogen decarboxylase family protein [Treponema primitia]